MLEQSGSTYSLSSLPFESCQVSLASCRLLKLIHDVMKQACSTRSPAFSTMLYQVNLTLGSIYFTLTHFSLSLSVCSRLSRDLCCCCPVQILGHHRDCAKDGCSVWSSLLDAFSLLSSSVRFYNDCCYIAHNATLLTHLYRQVIPSTGTILTLDRIRGRRMPPLDSLISFPGSGDQSSL
jgi:hypothetical protein